MMNPDMDPKRRLGHFDTVVSPTTTSITYHHRNLATQIHCGYSNQKRLTRIPPNPTRIGRGFNNS